MKGINIKHKVIEIFGVKESLIVDSQSLIFRVKKFVEKEKLKVVDFKHYDFKPYGTTIVFILSTSHLAVHTWPEYNYLHLDIVTCSNLSNNKNLTQIIKEVFEVQKQNIKIKEIKYED